MKNKKLIAIVLVLALAFAVFTFITANKSAQEEPELQQGQTIDLQTSQTEPQSTAVEQPSANSPPESGESQTAVSEPESEPLLVIEPENTETEPESSGADTETIEAEPGNIDTGSDAEDELLPEDGYYYSKDEVALYIHQYGKLPDNFMTKKEAEKLGWSGGSLEKYAPGKVIGGSQFGNREGLLPEADGRVYYECDIDTLGAKKRGAKRIVFSNDGLIYYTEDHYESFELLYGEED